MNIEQEILSRLTAVEHTQAVRVLFAVESGSRAWGFASPDSDYDVRFVYVHAAEQYLRVEPQRDVIELPIETTPSGEVDINGWDLRKALQLMLKANPVLIEWLESPIAYREVEGMRAEFRVLAAALFLPAACWHHYRSIARTNFRSYLQGEQVRLKKYFYVLRPLLACRWIETRMTAPPMDFRSLLAAVSLDSGVGTAIEVLLTRKAVTGDWARPRASTC